MPPGTWRCYLLLEQIPRVLTWWTWRQTWCSTLHRYKCWSCGSILRIIEQLLMSPWLRLSLIVVINFEFFTIFKPFNEAGVNSSLRMLLTKMVFQKMAFKTGWPMSFYQGSAADEFTSFFNIQLRLFVILRIMKTNLVTHRCLVWCVMSAAALPLARSLALLCSSCCFNFLS